MKLANVTIKNFKSIEDSELFEVGQTTCLVGKNEAGKTAVLTALNRLNPYEGNGLYNKDLDYPRRHLMDFEAQHPDGKAQVIETEWVLEPADQDAIAAVLHPSAAAKLTKVTVRKGYGDSDPEWEIHDFPAESDVVQYLVTSSSLHDEEKGQLVGATTIASLRTQLASVAPSERTTALTTSLSRYPENDPFIAAVRTLTLPKFLYFSQYQRMPGEIALTKLKERQTANTLKDEDRTFLAFCEFAGTPLDQLVSLNRFEPMNARFEGASSRITDQIFKYWSQNRFLTARGGRT